MPRIEHIFENNIEKKWCGKCKTFINIIDFNKAKTWDFLRPTCKNCLHKERIMNKDKIREYNVQYWKDTHEGQSKKHKKWRENNIEHLKEYAKKYREIHGKEIDKKQWQKRKNDETYRLKYLEYRRPYEKAKRQNDPNFKNKSTISKHV